MYIIIKYNKIIKINKFEKNSSMYIITYQVIPLLPYPYNLSVHSVYVVA